MSNLPKNVVSFNALAGQALGTLFEAFPRPVDLAAGEFFPFDAEAPRTVDGAYIAWDFFEHTIRWLRDEGYLRVKQSVGFPAHNPTFLRCTLTEKGLSTLTKPMPALENQDGKKTIGGQLAALVKSLATKGTGTIAVEATKLEFAHIFSYIFPS